MGGEPDGDGAINAEKLIATIKVEFEMTIDIEKLIDLLGKKDTELKNLKEISQFAETRVDNAEGSRGIRVHSGVGLLAAVPQQAGQSLRPRCDLHKRI